MQETKQPLTFWQNLWIQFKSHRLGYFCLYITLLFCFVGVYAPFLASSKPLVVIYDHQWFFPLFRYLFYTGFYTKLLDIFFNLLIFTLPLGLLCIWMKQWKLVPFVLCLQVLLFLFIVFKTPQDPAINSTLNQERQQLVLKQKHPLTWDQELQFMTPYAKLNLLLKSQQIQQQHQRLEAYSDNHETKIGSLWQIQEDNRQAEIARWQATLKEQADHPDSSAYTSAKIELNDLEERKMWIEEELKKITFEINPLLRNFHWEDDAGGDLELNQIVPWWELSRLNRKDLVAALIFGTRISLVVGSISVFLALLIGIPIGAYAGYYGGTFDIVVCRLLEIWESMPTFFMLLMIVAITQSKSIFLIISVIGLFGWTTFSRYIRGEFFKQRNLAYVEACHSLGFRDSYIMFSHILPNAIPPLLTLLPFAVMGAITSEASLSFLGLGEEGSTSWGVLMDEGRSAFPQESYLLWPPAILLTILLIAIALVGDAIRDALDPKLHK